MSRKEEKKSNAPKARGLKSGAKALTNGRKDKMSFNPSRSVGMKLFLAFFCAIFILVLAVGLFSYAQSKRIIQNKVDQASRQTITQVADKLELALGMYENESIKIFVDTDMSALLAQWKTASHNKDTDVYTQLTTIQAIGKKLSAITFSNNTIAAIHILPVSDLQPIGTSAFGDASNKRKYQDEDWFKKTLNAGGRVVWLDAKDKGYSSWQSSPSVGMARQLTISNTGDRDQVLLFEIPVSALGKYLSNIDNGQSGNTMIVSDSGNVIYSADPTQIGKASPIKLEQKDLDSSSEAAGSKTMTVGGQSQMVVYKEMAGNNWSIVYTVPVSVLVKDTNTIWMFMWLSILVAVLVAIGVGIMVANMIGKPLRTMRDLMHQAESGDLTVSMKIGNRRDEIGQLGQSFNQMMGQITGLVDQTNTSAAQVLSTAGELLNSAKQTTTSAKEIAIATEEIANGASSLAVEAERGNNLTHSIGDKMKLTMETNTRMGTVAADIQHSSEQGIVYMNELTAKTGSTEEMTRAMVEKVEKLKDSTSSIRKILEVLDSMTKQTNILSLNASIEAARAGAAGKGFMVVADEIRKLSEQSKANIGVVSEITETIQGEIEETVNVLLEAYPLFQDQIRSVKEADEIFKSVNRHMGSFVTQLDEVTESVRILEANQRELTEAMSNVSAVSEESSATSEEVASLSNEQLSVSQGLTKLAEDLNALSEGLQYSLSKFKI